MVELLQSGEKSGESRQAASSLNALLTGGARKKAAVRFTCVLRVTVPGLLFPCTGLLTHFDLVLELASSLTKRSCCVCCFGHTLRAAEVKSVRCKARFAGQAGHKLLE